MPTRRARKADPLSPGVGSPAPLGATPTAGGVNFSVCARGAERLDLLLYEHADDLAPSRVIPLDRQRHVTGLYWHVEVPGLAAGQLYGWRAHGPWAPERGMRFRPAASLLDPYGRAVAVPAAYRRGVAGSPAPKSVVADVDRYDWEGDEPLARPFAQTVIYELHVGGFTRHPNSGVDAARRGTFAGLIDKIPYLQSLGITAVELMPVAAFDTQDAPAGRPNYWGYAPMAFFAPHPGYSTRPEAPLAVLDEFRDMVKALHRAGIEVILDVVFNHTTEGGEEGPVLSWRGLADVLYYTQDALGRYTDFSGCGNTLNANRAVVRRMITDALRYWVRVMHVDGFRFDLAAILSRDEQGHPLASPPVLWDIDTDPVLVHTKLIAEAWDAAGLYQVGRFVGDRWKEWNGRFRDDVRAFVRGDPGMAPAMADRLFGSPDLYGERPREPAQSINFVTCHDGFTLADLVSYDRKHNEDNGEGNRDGCDHNLSWNCGVEGPTDDPQVLALRDRQVRNLLAINVLALGTPMLLMGDEVRRSQRGNNNAYCQDSPLSWFDWNAVEREVGLLRFVRGLLRLRGLRDSVQRAHHLTLAELTRDAQVRLHGVRLGHPDLGHHSHSLAVAACSLQGDLLMHFALNAWWQPLDFELPAVPGWAATGWRKIIDTSLPSPLDLQAPADAVRVDGPMLTVGPRSVVMLMASAKPVALNLGAAPRRVDGAA